MPPTRQRLDFPPCFFDYLMVSTPEDQHDQRIGLEGAIVDEFSR